MSKKPLTTKERNFRKLGAYIRLMDAIINSARSDLRHFTTRDEQAYLNRILGELEMVRLCAEDHLWEECGYEEADPSTLFYGQLGAEAIDAVDAEVTGKAKEIVAALFAPKSDTRRIEADGMPAIEWPDDDEWYDDGEEPELRCKNCIGRKKMPVLPR